MAVPNFTTKAQEALEAAQRIAHERSHAELEPAHLALALIQQEEGIVTAVLRALHVDVADVGRIVTERLAALPTVTGGGIAQLGLSRSLQALFQAALAAAKRMQDTFVSTEHLFLGFLTADANVTQRLASVGVTP
ncbi:MAG: hypothetical protein HYZ09_02650, partial [Candidatus Kerfeldbacteria bacterium]|nr:hypothetical protein [Candidatus Kerfeldbacteria bacterium]